MQENPGIATQLYIKLTQNLCIFSAQKLIELSLSTTVLTASWDLPSDERLYTLTCFVYYEEILSISLHTTESSAEIGIYEPDTTYYCSATLSGIKGSATIIFTTGGD